MVDAVGTEGATAVADPSARRVRTPPAAHVLHRGPGPLDRRGLRWLRADAGGLTTATVLAMLAMTPSLIPRTWLFQGIASGLSGAAGYAVGVAVWWVVRHTRLGVRGVAHVRSWAPRALHRAAWPLLLGAAPVAVVVMLVVGAQWQRGLAALSGAPPPDTFGYLRAAPVALAVTVLLVGVVRLARHADHVLTRGLRRWTRLPRRVAGAVAVVLLVVIVGALVNQVVLRASLAVADSAFAGRNDEVDPGPLPPTSPARSGSPASLVGWSTLGREGRQFVTGGRPPADLARVSGRPPREPVRAYVGLESAPTPDAQAALAVAELERTGAFTRRILVVVTTTGTGWVDGPVADDVEMLYGGDSAVVATQYSYLPSWLSFVVDRSRAEENGRTIFDAVAARVAAIPPGQPRPRLVAFGESLGSQGSEAAFGSLADARARADAVLWVGPPHSNRLWSALEERRDPGTPEVRPTYADGLVVRFSGGRDAAGVATAPPTPWEAPRVLYLQHASDPIVWWSPQLLWKRPDWLVEPRGRDVSGAMSWYPVVTFWQVTADMTNAQSTPDGHGHVYEHEVLDAWLAVAAPDGWGPADTDRARSVAG